MHGPQDPFSEQLHAEKYRSDGESFREAMNRVSSALTDNEDRYREFREVLLDMRFMPAGRVQTAMGSTKNVTPYNCFVSGTIEDSFVEGHGSIMSRASEAAATMRMGGGIGYDFSTLRPKGALIRKLQSKSSGPVNFMEIFDAICRCVASSGHRRGAQMGVMRVDHPDIEEFLHAKQNQHRLTGFNISIAITDEFMRAVEAGDMFRLRWGGQTFREVDARSLWENIMRSTWDWAEPGVLFIDRIEQQNNLQYCETISATNPCGEQPLPPYGACLLGSFNLVKYVSSAIDIETGRRKFDWKQFQEDIPVVVRAMDNVIDRAIYPLFEQEKEAKSKRRMGLGVTGLANALEAMGMLYGSEDFVEYQERILMQLAYSSYHASADLAKEKGSFPLFNAERYLRSNYLREADILTESLEAKIREHGIRNSHLISIAPTGTISMCADNVSSGIEPVFAYETQRAYVGPEGPETVLVQDYGYKHFGVNGRVSADVTVKQHLAVLAVASKYSDSAVSKTCNVPADLGWHDFKEVYIQAWKDGAKGCTTFNTGGKRTGVLKEVTKEEEPAACYVDFETGKRECE